MENDISTNDTLLLFPVWEEGVWSALQKKAYREAEERFASFVRSLTPDERRFIPWGNVLLGVPAMRGELTEGEWTSSVRPFLIREFLEIATGRMVSEVLNNFAPNERIAMFRAFVSSIPGEAIEDKERWIVRQKSSSSLYFLAAPAQSFDAHSPDLDKHVPLALAEQKFATLPSSLQRALFSYETAETIHRAATENLLNSPKIRAVARAVGHILLGFESPSKTTEEIKRAAIIDERTSETLAREFRSRIFAPLLSDIEDAYEPPEDFEESSQKAFSGPSFLSDFAARAPATAPHPSTPSPSKAPFVLHEERTFTADAKKESMKGFSLPFGLFKPKTGEAPQTPRATVEAPKTIHYSEYRSNVAPGSGGEFINLETFGKTSVAPLPPTPTQEKVSPAIPINIKKPEAPPPPKAPNSPANTPKVEGNMVDLR